MLYLEMQNLSNLIMTISDLDINVEDFQFQFLRIFFKKVNFYLLT